MASGVSSSDRSHTYRPYRSFDAIVYGEHDVTVCKRRTFTSCTLKVVRHTLFVHKIDHCPEVEL